LPVEHLSPEARRVARVLARDYRGQQLGDGVGDQPRTAVPERVADAFETVFGAHPDDCVVALFDHARRERYRLVERDRYRETVDFSDFHTRRLWSRPYQCWCSGHRVRMVRRGALHASGQD
jgi:hypothetical protein